MDQYQVVQCSSAWGSGHDHTLSRHILPYHVYDDLSARAVIIAEALPGCSTYIVGYHTA